MTEAACKTVFTQRLKQSGMTWKVEGGQWIVDLRVIHLSGVWCGGVSIILAGRRCFPKWGLRGVQGRKSPKRPHNRWHWRDCTRADRANSPLPPRPLGQLPRLDRGGRHFLCNRLMSFRPWVVSASPPRPSPLERILDGLSDDLGQVGTDGQVAEDLRGDLGNSFPCPGRVVQPTCEAMIEGFGLSRRPSRGRDER